jgi:hypothetical protein
MMKSAFQIFGIAVLALSPLTPAGGDAVQLLERTDAFEVAYGMSFQIDACGDATTGQLYRQALVEKFENCPFSAEARERFKSRTAALASKSNSALDRYVSENGKLPDRLDGMKRSCQEERRSSDYMNLRSQLQQYVNGSLSAGEIFVDRCDVTAGAP